MASSRDTNNFIEEIIERDNESGKYAGAVVTRFPPEPNGYLHIGHAKSIALNFGLARKYDGTCHLRFDDTNPETEDPEFVEAIKRDVHWLGYEWGDNLFFASDYFEQLYDYAVKLIGQGLAYVDSSSMEEIRKNRGTVTEPGTDSPYRDRTIEENLKLFGEMRDGVHGDGTHVLRAKMDMGSPNMKLRDPLLYRIKHASHYRTGDEWCIYPMYDFAHPLSDAIENITHSLCTLEFENNRPIYDWLVDAVCESPRPYQYEFARLNLNYTVMSKRKLLRLVEEKFVDGWDDPRMYTIAGLRRRGYTPSSIRSFAERVGVARANSRSDVGLLEYSIRDDLNAIAPRVMAVLRPLRIELTNYDEGKVEWLEAPYFPHDVPKEGSRKVPFSRNILIDRSDFKENPGKKFYRLSPGNEVRLRYGYVIRCTDVIKNDEGDVVELKGTCDLDTRGGDTPDGRRVRGTIQWVSAEHAIPIETRLYDRLFSVENPEEGVEDFTVNLNPDSIEILSGSVAEPSIANDDPGTRYQFEREGYFWQDPEDSSPDKLVFNRIVMLKDSWEKTVKAKPATIKPRAKETVPKEVRTIVDSPATLKMAEDFGLSVELARQLSKDEAKKAIFDAIAEQAGELSAAVANWIVNELPGDVQGIDNPGPFLKMVAMFDSGDISQRIARQIQVEVIESGTDPETVVDREGLAQISDPSTLEAMADDIIARNTEKAELYRSGKKGLIGFFMGQLMQASGGKANPEVARGIIEKKLG
ncbi:MAG: glutamine--tRNA ligase/YqeY domain fusion protein [Rhodothermales bacterium]|nr:glutamine--tRNA ligase/YqeY domain fusion protein [Rhodothermales bacterium]